MLGREFRVGYLILFLHAFKVLLINIATVITQTQPGTGVILCHAKSILPVSASQYIFQSITVNHTSIIIVSFFSIFSFNKPGIQTATTTISEFFVCIVKSLVLLLQLVTVAQAFIKRAVTGFQTILLFQITVTSFQDRSIFSALKISIIHAGVQGTSHELSHIKIFH
jgi:hypothetical protein